ncbi:4-hydroxybenzoate octaprenyltransferase [Telmatospirillum siberiense]|uniref:4-hydroxybenzoate octaprenyltransferase n=1 Tax=Telmatospirillum siberiense TaxID=382514 RepID=A0A2N3PTS9_9PROT|nr:4-hydroxybenzoate octaprenyltransferase [Telmatospirillum siberiense]PKU23812.1 4-hydroxybenzoate octaprenyltransferase [Telmatospirillum siberiense]
MKTSSTVLGDIPVGDWIDRLSPLTLRPYLRLMRLDRPIGTWLLLLPGWWSIALGADTWPDLRLLVLFGIGAVVMRGAGCTFNDIVDRDFDGRVARTAARPIPSGAVNPLQASAFLALQLAVGLIILLQFNRTSVILGAASLALVFTYPFMKRITYWPQAWLGLTFNWGALLGWAAAGGGEHWSPVLLYAGGIFWTLGYDTIYAHQDKQDDALIGIRSTALRLGAATPAWLVGFYSLALALFAATGWAAGLSWPFYPLLAVAGGQLFWQIRALDIDNTQDCLDKFKSNRVFGWLMMLAIVTGKIM